MENEKDIKYLKELVEKQNFQLLDQLSIISNSKQGSNEIQVIIKELKIKIEEYIQNIKKIVELQNYKIKNRFEEETLSNYNKLLDYYSQINLQLEIRNSEDFSERIQLIQQIQDELKSQQNQTSNQKTQQNQKALQNLEKSQQVEIKKELENMKHIMRENQKNMERMESQHKEGIDKIQTEYKEDIDRIQTEYKEDKKKQQEINSQFIKDLQSLNLIHRAMCYNFILYDVAAFCQAKIIEKILDVPYDQSTLYQLYHYQATQEDKTKMEDIWKKLINNNANKNIFDINSYKLQNFIEDIQIIIKQRTTSGHILIKDLDQNLLSQVFNSTSSASFDQALDQLFEKWKSKVNNLKQYEVSNALFQIEGHAPVQHSQRDLLKILYALYTALSPQIKKD